MSVSPGGVHKIESRLAREVSHFKVNEGMTGSVRDLRRLQRRLDLTIGGCVIDGTARGWVRYYNRMTDLSTLGHLDALVRDLLARHGLEGRVRPKSFHSAYWASRENGRFRRYAIDCDNVNPSDARLFLEEEDGWRRSVIAQMSKADLTAAYKRAMRRLAADLEHDLEPAS